MLNKNFIVRFSNIIYIFLFSIILSENFPVIDIMVNGNQDSRINIIFLGDGYTEDQMNDFILDVEDVTTGLFNSSPYSNYLNYFNVYAVKVPSNESGTDHPGTASDCGVHSNNVFYADTYFDSTFDNGNIHRALVINNSSAVYNVLMDNTPYWDIVFMMVNTTMYGGTGGAFATFSRHSDSIEIAIHEAGHSFAGLSDEYWAGFQFANENVNMTQNSNELSIVWNQWLYDYGIGIYPYENPGNSWHRPHQSCKMRYLGSPFCSVCSEHTIKTIYSILDPINIYFPESLHVVLPSNGTAYFIVEPIYTFPNTLYINWFIDNQPIQVETPSIVFDASSYSEGQHQIKAVVSDLTELVRNDNLNLLQSEVTWNITIEPSPMGDLNLDGNIDISDIVLAINLILNNQFNNLADINEDGFINVQDIILLINIILYR